MEHEITHRPSYAQLTLTLEPGESVRAEGGAMVSMAGDLDIQTQAEGGLLKSLSRSVLGGESFFMNTFSASGPSSVQLAPALAGDIQHHRLDAETLFVQSTSFLASHPDVSVDTKFGGGKSFFGGEGLFLLKLSGSGPAFLASYGAIDEHTVEPGETLTVDTGHIVAFEESVDFDVKRIGGLKSTLWTQTRSPDAFLAWLIPKLPTNSSSQ